MTPAPVAIGALGGSGTRVVARLVRAAGVEMGGVLNGADDNLVFSLLIKRPRWLIRADLAAVSERLAIFAAHMGGERLGLRARATVLRSLLNDLAMPRREALRAARGALRRREAPTGTWGWKEPNTHLVLDALSSAFPRLGYIHVIRHGIDLAFGANTQQLVAFGPLFGIDPAVGPRPVAQLDYWIRANRRALDLGPRRLGERFHLLRYDELVANPATIAGELFSFLGANPTGAASAAHEVCSPSPSPTRDLSVFRPDQLEAVERLGFTL